MGEPTVADLVSAVQATRTVAEALRVLRALVPLTQAEIGQRVAEVLGRPKPYAQTLVSAWHHGEVGRSPNASQLAALEQVYRLPPNTLLRHPTPTPLVRVRYSGPSLRVFVNGGWVSEPIRDDFAGEVDRFRRLFGGQRLEMATADVVALWRPSGHDPHDRTDWSWDDEAAFVREHPAEGFDAWEPFVADIAANGVREPLELGDDGAVCGGHHRICAAVELGVKRLPVEFITGCVKPSEVTLEVERD